ncbi:PAS domain-containing protein [Paremcibacter congregatus]|uniref:PAS domain-containing protein n=1 Tax=Paremcibacter congregatus TaxID=2043170 RepID=A0A2G4YLT2_9PROT|nr:PAS domain-containing protein [Paremcibacter congregatus]PHZ83257.1 hypothetical protein CRD36_16930 [Paremcibacter congregatus]QDE28270.1 PAS domain-containing protein [Paremcibacter congregatus]
MTHLDPTSFTCEKQRELYAYWLKVRGESSMPSRKDINPMDIPHLLSSIWMADVLHGDPVGFKARLFGTDLVRAFQLEATDRRLDEFSFTGGIIKRMTALVETRQPYFWKGPFPFETDDFKSYSTVSLPLSNDDKVVNIIICSVHFYS